MELEIPNTPDSSKNIKSDSSSPHQKSILNNSNIAMTSKDVDTDDLNTNCSDILKIKNDASSEETKNALTLASSNVDIKDDGVLSKLNKPTKIEDIFSVVAPKGKMREKHEKSAPYHIFFPTCALSPETHTQPLSITFQELLDPSLGKLKSSLQINYMLSAEWLLLQYFFAGYSDKPLTVLYGYECDDIKNIVQDEPNVEAHFVDLKSDYGLHHPKISMLHYEDESIRLVISTANLYPDDWENRTQGLWLSPICPRLPHSTKITDGESPTGFKKSLITFLNTYDLPCLLPYVEIVKNIDFSHINVFFVASVPGIHSNLEWGLNRINTLLSKHCVIPQNEVDKWPLIVQSSGVGNYGKDPKMWLCGNFQQSFCRSFKSFTRNRIPELKFIYPRFENATNSDEYLQTGGTCLPYEKSVHDKQQWLNQYLHDWSAKHSGRDRAMPHIKSYLRLSPDANKAAFFLLTSHNVSKNAWGTFNKYNRTLRINSYEAGVLFLPKFVINEDYFSVEINDPKRLPIPYDLPLIPYESGDNPFTFEMPSESESESENN